ncbi:multiprotein-bridging factor 1 family protein [Paenarthrobacter nicotinovorans]|uniref:helix-turn-helix domain-containing protein n=1 Tax=Paenarthrobacter nicotinovorans TaxID=29320 RepID=UPI0037FD9063
MNDREALKTIGQLVASARITSGKTQLQFAKDAGMDVKTLRTLEAGDRLLHDTKLHAIEKELGWRPMAIRQIWDRRADIDLGALSGEDMRLGANQETWDDIDAETGKPVTKASQLTTEELLMELQYRVRHLTVEVSKLKEGREGTTTHH